MREISVEVTPETYEALEIERSLIGFKSRSAYLRWIIDNRAGIDQDDQPAWLVDAYRQRVDEQDETETDAGGGAEVMGQANDEWDRAVADTRRESEPGRADGPTGSTTADRPTADAATTGGATASESPTASGSDDGGSSTRIANTDGGTTIHSQDGLELRGTVGTRTVERGPRPGSDGGPIDSCADGETATSSGTTCGGSGRRSEAERGVDSINLTPERIERIREDAIASDADLLGSVKGERVDELTRRAVAKTRKRLNRDVQTGLAYDSTTSLADGTVRPGEDVVDLEALSVPGRSETVVAKRREAVGHAVAFLKDRGRARKTDFVDALYETVPAGYDTADGWWRCVKAGLKQVDAVDGGAGSRVWRFDG